MVDSLRPHCGVWETPFRTDHSTSSRPVTLASLHAGDHPTATARGRKLPIASLHSIAALASHHGFPFESRRFVAGCVWAVAAGLAVGVAWV
ncbi:MAG: hypothetical protein HZB38_10825 [Planctomycetes bacterium]|nr:hypothetical protein [Planctomycetota bacterium]